MADIPRKHIETQATAQAKAQAPAAAKSSTDYPLHDEDYVPPIVLSTEERLQVNRRASSGILRSLAAQAVMGCVAVLASWFFAGAAGAGSALIGACAYFVPNAIFALRLLLGLFGASQASPLTFFVGEAFKLGTAVIVLGMAAWWGRDWLVWPAMLLGLLSVLKGYVLLLLFRKLP